MPDEVKELAIGAIGEVDGVKVECVKADQTPGVWVCCDCRLHGDDCMSNSCAKVACHPMERIDGLYVTFKEV